MTNIPQFYHVALLIDADNAQLRYLEQARKFSEYYGELKICRADGDWNKLPLSSSCKEFDALKIDRIQVDRVGKNATDHHLLVEIGEILGESFFWANKMRVFVLVSGDGDFASACKLIQERGKQVIGIGNRIQTSKNLPEACNEFYYLEDLKRELVLQRDLHRKREVQPRPGEGLGWRPGMARWR